MTLTVEPIFIRDKEFTPKPGSHQPNGEACIMEMVSYLAGEWWSDRPKCSSPVIGAFCRSLWDRTPRSWPGLLARMDRIAGSATSRDVDRARGYLAADLAVRRFAPRWLRRAGLDDDAATLEALPPVIDVKTAKVAHAAGRDIRERAWERREEALWRIREAAGAAWAAEAAGVAGVAWAAEAAGVAGIAWAAWAAEAAEAAGVAWAAEAAEAAGAAGAAWAAEAAGAAGIAGVAEAAGAAGIAWADLKGKTYSELRAFFRAKLEEALGGEIDASIDDGLELLDAMLDLGAVPA